MKKAIVAVQDFRWSFHLLVLGIFGAIAFYMFCVSTAVHNAVTRNNALDSISELQASVSELETRYIAATNSMTLDFAAEVGLTEPRHKMFLSINR